MNTLRPLRGKVELAAATNIYTVTWPEDRDVTPTTLNQLETEVEGAVLACKVIHISTALPQAVFERAGVVPLRWGNSRIIEVDHSWYGRNIRKSVMDGNEPVRAWRLWRYAWDDKADLLALPALKRAPKVTT